jgi:hypothetical protein
MSNKALVGWSLAYWLCAAFIIFTIGAVGDCFESREVCEAGARESRFIVAAFFGSVYVVILLIRLVVSSRR